MSGECLGQFLAQNRCLSVNGRHGESQEDGVERADSVSVTWELWGGKTYAEKKLPLTQGDQSLVPNPRSGGRAVGGDMPLAVRTHKLLRVESQALVGDASEQGLPALSH